MRSATDSFTTDQITNLTIIHLYEEDGRQELIFVIFPFKTSLPVPGTNYLFSAKTTFTSNCSFIFLKSISGACSPPEASCNDSIFILLLAYTGWG